MYGIRARTPSPLPTWEDDKVQKPQIPFSQKIRKAIVTFRNRLVFHNTDDQEEKIAGDKV